MKLLAFTWMYVMTHETKSATCCWKQQEALKLDFWASKNPPKVLHNFWSESISNPLFLQWCCTVGNSVMALFLLPSTSILPLLFFLKKISREAQKEKRNEAWKESQFCKPSTRNFCSFYSLTLQKWTALSWHFANLILIKTDFLAETSLIW